MMSVSMGSCFYWLFDMIASFFVGYHTEAFVELGLAKIARRYLRTWFGVDFSLVVLDLGFIVLGLSQNVSFMRIGKTLSRGMRVLRHLRIVKMHGIITGLMERIRSEHVRTVIAITGQVLVIILVNHFSACGWYALSYTGGTRDNWRDHYLIFEEHQFFLYRYATAMHWSLTQFTPASMEVTPKNVYERTYVIVVIIFALVMFSSFVSAITAAMSRLRAINEDRLAQEDMLRKYITDNRVSR